MTLDDYLRLPWTIVRTEHDDDGEYIALRIEELPGFVVASASETELELLFWDALKAFLSSYLEEGEEPPVPQGRMGVNPQVERLPAEPKQTGVRYTGEACSYRTGTSVRNWLYMPMPA